MVMVALLLPMQHGVLEGPFAWCEHHRARHGGGLPEHAQQYEDKDEDASHRSESLTSRIRRGRARFFRWGPRHDDAHKAPSLRTGMLHYAHVDPRVDFRGAHIAVTLDHKRYIEVKDTHITGWLGGRVDQGRQRDSV